MTFPVNYLVRSKYLTFLKEIDKHKHMHVVQLIQKCEVHVGI